MIQPEPINNDVDHLSAAPFLENANPITLNEPNIETIEAAFEASIKKARKAYFLKTREKFRLDSSLDELSEEARELIDDGEDIVPHIHTISIRFLPQTGGYLAFFSTVMYDIREHALKKGDVSQRLQLWFSSTFKYFSPARYLIMVLSSSLKDIEYGSGSLPDISLFVHYFDVWVNYLAPLVKFLNNIHYFFVTTPDMVDELKNIGLALETRLRQFLVVHDPSDVLSTNLVLWIEFAIALHKYHLDQITSDNSNHNQQRDVRLAASMIFNPDFSSFCFHKNQDSNENSMEFLAAIDNFKGSYVKEF